MRFLYHPIPTSHPEDRVLSDRLVTDFKMSEHESPGALMDALRAYGEENELGLQVTTHVGTVNVHGPRGMVLRIKSQA